jgi:penicillin-binding protein 1B
VSQLNHVLAKRQPGSIFKPFVYAAALDSAVEGGSHVLTPSSMVVDQPTTFWMDGRAYEPHNFDHKYRGEITFREALAHSINVAAVKVAQMAGYDAVVDMAKRAGLTSAQPTPAVALGSYEVTPIEAAGAYTVFANQGDYVKPTFIRMVRAQDGRSMFKNKPTAKHVLDPRVSFLLTSMMEEVLRTGTAAGARAHYAFNVPSAGKTGTSRDGWFAGYTSELLCVVWVGFDDNRDLDLEGAHSAAPIWMEFMKKALDYREYRSVRQFDAPDGIVSIDIDPLSGMPATPNCPTTRSEVYIAGTQPVGSCPLHGGTGRGVTNIAGWETPSDRPATAPSGDTAPRISGSAGDGMVSASGSRRPARPAPDTAAAAEPDAAKNTPEKKEEKKGILRRIFGVFK